MMLSGLPDFTWQWTPLYAHYVFALAGIIASITDFWRQKIYNWLTLPTLLLGLILNGLQGGWSGFSSAFMGCLVAGGIYLVLGLMGAMKGGDLKLAAAMGACLGWPLTLGALFYGFMAGGLLAVVWALMHGTLRQSLHKVGFSVMARFTPGLQAQSELEKSASPPMPYGAAIALGGILSQWYLPSHFLPGM